MRTPWRIASWLVTVPVLLLLMGFAIDNRAPTIVSLWPVGVELALPIYMLALLPLALGLLIGSAAQWLLGLRHRVAAKRLGREIATLKAELAALRAAEAARNAQVIAPQPRSSWRLLGPKPTP